TAPADEARGRPDQLDRLTGPDLPGGLLGERAGDQHPAGGDGGLGRGAALGQPPADELTVEPAPHASPQRSDRRGQVFLLLAAGFLAAGFFGAAAAFLLAGFAADGRPELPEPILRSSRARSFLVARPSVDSWVAIS